MNVLLIDTETTGLDTSNDRIIEIGCVVWDVNKHLPIHTYMHLMWDESYPPITEVITKVTGIEESFLKKYGLNPKAVLRDLEWIIEKFEIEYMVAHNGNRFDRPILMAEQKRNSIDAVKKNWIDTRIDLSWDIPRKCNKLGHLAADIGFVNPFPHRALFDCLTLGKILSNFNFEEVMKRAASPLIHVKAEVSFDEKEKAKERGFRWEKLEDKTYPKWWVREMKECDLEALKKEAPFKIVRIK